MLSKESAGWLVASLAPIATVTTPRSEYSRAMSLKRSSHARTYGQWLHQKATTTAGRAGRVLERGLAAVSGGQREARGRLADRDAHAGCRWRAASRSAAARSSRWGSGPMRPPGRA